MSRPKTPLAGCGGEAALGILLCRLRDRLDESGEPALKRLAFGIAR